MFFNKTFTGDIWNMKKKKNEGKHIVCKIAQSREHTDYIFFKKLSSGQVFCINLAYRLFHFAVIGIYWDF